MKRPIKVAHIATAYQSIVTILDSKLRLLDSFDDLEVTAISSGPVINMSRIPAVRHLQVEIARRMNPLADLRSTGQLYRLLIRERFDIVHSHTSKAGVIAAVAAWMAGVPLICHTQHGMPFFKGQKKLRYVFYQCIERIACQFRDYLFSQTRQGLTDCTKLMGNRNRVLFEGNGVVVELVKESAEEQFSEAVKYFPFQGKGLKVVLLSRFEPVKRVPDFFRVVDKLRETGIRTSCVVAGAGFLEEQLRAQIVDMKLEDQINLVGFSDCPHGLLLESDVVVLCSEKEGIPRSIMEAMALRKPVVATAVEGTEEVVDNGKTGFLVPLGDINAMVERIAFLAENKAIRAQMGDRGLARIKEHFSDAKVVDFLRDFYVANTHELQRKER
jgi:glycosyltransferase involved in cell wall biosynthesis